jgi:hypothetical protein
MHSFDAGGAARAPSTASALNGALIYRRELRGTDRAALPPAPANLERPSAVVGLDDTAYVVNGSALLAVGHRGGAPLWSYRCPPSQAALTSPALDGGGATVVVVCTGALASSVAALSTATGALVPGWAAPVPIVAQAAASPIIIRTGGDDGAPAVELIIVADDGGHVRALVLANGADAWSVVPRLGSAVRGAPCFDGERLYAFSVGGAASAISPSGAVLWNSTAVTAGAPGFSSSCATVAAGAHPSGSGIAPALVVAGAHDFLLHAMHADDGTPYCHFATGGAVTQGVSVVNRTALAPSADGFVHAVALDLACGALFKVPLRAASRVAIGGDMLAVVGHSDGVSAFDARPLHLGAVRWELSATEDPADAPAIGPHGNVYAGTRSGALLSVGVTAAFVAAHTQDATMAASANVSDPDARAELDFLCTHLTAMLASDTSERLPSKQSKAAANATAAALNQSCATLASVAARRPPWGARRQSFIGVGDSGTLQDPAWYLNFLQNGIKLLLGDAASKVANLTQSATSIQQQIDWAAATRADFAAKLKKQDDVIGQTEALLKAIKDSLIMTKLRLDVTSLVVKGEVALFTQLWLEDAKNFTAAALQESIAGVQAYQGAIEEIGQAAAVISSGFIYALFHISDITGPLKEAMADLKTAAVDGFKFVLDAVQIAKFLEAWLSLKEIAAFFAKIGEVNEELCNATSLPSALPAIITEEITMDKAQYWFQTALEQMQKLGPLHPGGAVTATTIESFIADSKTTLSLDLAFYGAFAQYQAQLAQRALLLQSQQDAENAMAEPAVQQLAVGAALQIARTQLYQAQLNVLRASGEACAQFEVWSLESCSDSGVAAIPKNPTAQDIDTFCAALNTAIANAVPAGKTPSSKRVQIVFNRTKNPEVFIDAANGTFYFNVGMPSDPGMLNLRLQAYQMYFLPVEGNQITEQGAVMQTQFRRTGTSQFMAQGGKTFKRFFNFTHANVQGATMSFKPNTRACNPDPQVPEPVCPVPWCTGSSQKIPFNMASPYGLWTVRVNKKIFLNTSAITGAYLQFMVDGTADDDDLPILQKPFMGGDETYQQYPVLPSELCPTT